MSEDKPTLVTLETRPMPHLHDCWNSIGVAGNGTCRELVRHIHCRNCPVYAAAAAQLLDRPLTQDYRREWTEHFAAEKTLSTPARVSAVIFRIGAEWLALRTEAFQEIAEHRAMHSLPHRKPGGIVLGLVNVRGELLICVALDVLLGLTKDNQQFTVQPPHSRRNYAFGRRESGAQRSTGLDFGLFERFLISDWKGNRFAFPVDEVQGIHRFHQEELRPAPATVARSGAGCSAGIFPWRGRAVGFLNADALFTTLNKSLS